MDIGIKIIIAVVVILVLIGIKMVCGENLQIVIIRRNSGMLLSAIIRC